jgi:hypothetical protein
MYAQGARSRLERVRGLISAVSDHPTVLNEQLTDQITAILWHRMGAPPVFHVVMTHDLGFV